MEWGGSDEEEKSLQVVWNSLTFSPLLLFNLAGHIGIDKMESRCLRDPLTQFRARDPTPSTSHPLKHMPLRRP